MLLTSLLQNPLVFLVVAIPLLYSLVLHELAHAVCANWFGDTTAKDRGRITLNPLAHLDLLGTILLLIVGFGWAKPVPINYARIHPKKAGVICCSLAGVTTNFLIALTSLILFKYFYIRGIPSHSLLLQTLVITANINIILASFNLIPIPPLDGSRVLAELMPKNTQYFFYNMERYGIIILIILLNLHILDPVIGFIRSVLLSIISLFL